ADQDRDDGNDHQQLDEGEAPTFHDSTTLSFVISHWSFFGHRALVFGHFASGPDVPAPAGLLHGAGLLVKRSGTSAGPPPSARCAGRSLRLRRAVPGRRASCPSTRTAASGGPGRARSAPSGPRTSWPPRAAPGPGGTVPGRYRRRGRGGPWPALADTTSPLCG